MPPKACLITIELSWLYGVEIQALREVRFKRNRSLSLLGN